MEKSYEQSEKFSVFKPERQKPEPEPEPEPESEPEPEQKSEPESAEKSAEQFKQLICSEQKSGVK